MKNVVIGLLAVSLAGCGLLGNGRSDGPKDDGLPPPAPPPPSTSPAPAEEETPMDESTSNTTLPKIYSIDGSSFGSFDSYEKYEDREVVWTYRVTVNGKQVSEGKNATRDLAREELGLVPLADRDHVRIEVEALTHEGKLLASNFEPKIDVHPKQNDVWKTECEDVGSEFQILSEAVGDSLAQWLEFKLCDYSDTVRDLDYAEDHVWRKDPRWITFECSGRRHDPLPDLEIFHWSTTLGVCKPRYEPLANATESTTTRNHLVNPDGTVKLLEKPADVSPIAFYIPSGALLTFDPTGPAATRYRLLEAFEDEYVLFAGMPYELSCNVIEFEVSFRSSFQDPTQKARLFFEWRHESDSLNGSWVADDQTKLPDYEQIRKANFSYAGSRLWLHCGWNNDFGKPTVPL